jgi:hypothetical protein
MRFACLLIAFGVVGALVGCGEERRPAPGFEVDDDDDDGGTLVCVDRDEDGAGENCEIHDCDDDDPNITDECRRCREPNLGCPCEAGSEATYCRPEELGDTIERDGQVLTCTEGARYCREHEQLDGEYLWSDCEGIYNVVPSGN